MKINYIIKKVIDELFSPFKMLIIYFPGRLGYLIRNLYYKRVIDSKGRLNLGIGITFTGLERIKFGSNINIMDYSNVLTVVVLVAIATLWYKKTRKR